MTILEAFEKAIAGGWQWNSFGYSAQDMLADYDFHLADELLKPSFWRALGKTEGWDDGRHDDPTYAMVQDNRWMWEHKWHRLIDHLADGGSIESFFATL